MLNSEWHRDQRTQFGRRLRGSRIQRASPFSAQERVRGGGRAKAASRSKGCVALANAAPTEWTKWICEVAIRMCKGGTL